MVEFLVGECQAEVNARDSQGARPMHYAAEGNKVEALDALLRNGAKVTMAVSVAPRHGLFPPPVNFMHQWAPFFVACIGPASDWTDDPPLHDRRTIRASCRCTGRARAARATRANPSSARVSPPRSRRRPAGPPARRRAQRPRRAPRRAHSPDPQDARRHRDARRAERPVTDERTHRASPRGDERQAGRDRDVSERGRGSGVEGFQRASTRGYDAQRGGEVAARGEDRGGRRWGGGCEGGGDGHRRDRRGQVQKEEEEEEEEEEEAILRRAIVPEETRDARVRSGRRRRRPARPVPAPRVLPPGPSSRPPPPSCPPSRKESGRSRWRTTSISRSG